MSTHSSGYYSIDADYRIIGFNDTARRLYPQLQVGRQCYKVLMGLDAPCPVCPVANGVYGPKTYLDPIRHIYETVDAVETVLPDGSRGHALVFSTVGEGERLAGNLPTGEDSLRLLGAINLIAQKYSVVCGVNLSSRKLSVFRCVNLVGSEKPGLFDNMDYGDALDLLITRYVHPEERPMIRELMDLEAIRQRLQQAPSFTAHCKVLLDAVHYFDIQVTRGGEPDEYEDFVVAIACEDDDVNSRRIYEKQVETLLSSITHAVMWFHLDLTGNRILKSGGTSAFLGNTDPEGAIDELTQKLAVYIPSQQERQEYLDTYKLQAMKRAFDTGKAEIVREMRTVYDDMVIRWSRCTVRLLMNPGNNHLEGIFYCEDVTREREAIKTQQGIVQTLIGNYLDAFLLNTRERTAMMIKHDGEQSTRLVQNARVFDYDQMVEMYVSSFVYPDDREMMRQVLKLDNVMEKLSLQKEYAQNYRVVYGGELHYYQSRFIKNEEYGIVVMGSLNVDDVVASEIEHQKQLQKALEEANRANAEKTRFLARMSHDMRTPLNGIVGLLELDEKHPDDIGYLRENRKKAAVVTSHLISLINDVLDMAKIEDGSIVLAHEAFCITEKCAEAMAVMQPQAQEKCVTLAVHFEPQEERLTYLYGSPLHLCRAMMNILGNCIKYNRENGSVTVDTQIIACDRQTVTYRWTITDTGIGMSQEFLERIFEPFSQEATDARSVYHGTGLGMSIAKALIEQMGGTLEVSSRQNVGSTFVVTIPFELADKGEVESAEQAQEASIRGMRILLAEDNELNRQIAEALLWEEGAEVTSVVNGMQAVDAVRDNPPGTFDLVLMDVMMPVMDGNEATRKIRQLYRPDAQSLPIVAMTANAFSEDVKKSLDAGMNDHISKPLDLPKMLRTIAQYRT